MIFALRTLHIRSERKLIPVEIKVLVPLKVEKKRYKCNFQIDWPDNLYEGEVYGVDSVQALFLSYGIIGINLYVSEYHLRRELFFEKEGAGYGFPLSRENQHLAEGDDRLFYL